METKVKTANGRPALTVADDRGRSARGRGPAKGAGRGRAAGAGERGGRPARRRPARSRTAGRAVAGRAGPDPRRRGRCLRGEAGGAGRTGPARSAEATARLRRNQRRGWRGADRRAGPARAAQKVHAVHAGLEAAMRAMGDLEGWYRVTVHRRRPRESPCRRVAADPGERADRRSTVLPLWALPRCAGQAVRSRDIIPENTLEVRW